MAGVARDLLRQVRQRLPALPARGAGAHEVVLPQRLAPLLDGGGGEGGAVHVGDLLALGDRLGGEAERAVAVIDPPVWEMVNEVGPRLRELVPHGQGKPGWQFNRL